ncbi:GxxExxY protein [Patescibacteria group bacterium]|nr:GxxExxY protein [Patescibacteria group bacterium]
MEGKIIYKEESYEVTGILFETHNELGRYCREKQYCDLIENKLKLKNKKYKREYRVENTGNITDFIFEDKIVIEAKAKDRVTKEDYYQLQRYLQATGIKLGLLVNFRDKYLKPIRVVRIDTDARKKFQNNQS